MVIIYYLAFAYLTWFGFYSFFKDKDTFSKSKKFLILFFAIVSIFIMVFSDWTTRLSDKFDNMVKHQKLDTINRAQTESQKGIEALKKTEEDGTATVSDYLRYVVLELQNIRFGLNRGKDLSEYITDYFSQVRKIPDYPETKWKATESIIGEYYKMVVQNNFSNRETHVYVNGKRIKKKVYDIFCEERKKLLEFKWGKQK